MRADIELHSDGCGREGHPAINVKWYGRWPESDLDPETLQGIWQTVVEVFWEQATETAHLHGYSGVFSEGRSGGWLVPYFQGGKKFFHWPGQGGNLGYPSYPDVEDKTESKRFREFRFDIEQLLAAVPSMIADEIAFQNVERKEN